MVKRPLTSVRAERFTPPATEVAVTLAFSRGWVSGPVTWPRMTSTPWARSEEGAARMRKSADTMEETRRDTGRAVGRGRRRYSEGGLNTRKAQKGLRGS